MSELRYFQLNDAVGERPTDPLVEMSLPITTPAMAGGDVVELTETHIIRPAATLGERVSARVIPGTRIVEAQAEMVAGFLAADGRFHEIDKPSKKQTSKQREQAAEPVLVPDDLKEQ